MIITQQIKTTGGLQGKFLGTLMRLNAVMLFIALFATEGARHGYDIAERSAIPVCKTYFNEVHKGGGA